MADLKESVFQALGEASMCWEETPRGIFDSTNATRIGDELIADIKRQPEWLEQDSTSLPTANPLPGRKGMDAMPNPTPEQIENDPLFNTIWQTIKSWDINSPEYYQGYCGATGSHVMLIYNAIKAIEE